jgi:D-alanyl-D-alanine carboxypeptidase/D-alanyl-D-alanine-endopeptidase (penicillin-binding protein 4)
LIPAPSLAADADIGKSIDEIIDGPDYKHASFGILVVDGKTGETVYRRNPDTMMAPASVTKLFTCAAAIIALGPDYRFTTPVYARGVPMQGTLHGDLILIASGDLTMGGRTDKNGKTRFTNKDHTYANAGSPETELTESDPLAGLDALAKQVKASGIEQLDGEVLIDDRLFARARGSGSGPSVVTPILINDNVVDIIVEPGKNEGDPARVTTRPASAYYQMDALVTTVAEGTKGQVNWLPVAENQFAVRGAIAKGSKPIVGIYPVDHPASFARALFIEALRRNGVKANAMLPKPAKGPTIVPVTLPPRGGYAGMPIVASLVSAPLKDSLAVTLKVSHNLYASTLPCLVATTRGGATADQGLRTERRILRELGVDTNAISFAGGAGGNEADHVTARSIVQLLQGMSRRPEWPAYKDCLPILGVDGTLADVVKRDNPARGKVFAKTGTLAWADAANGRTMLTSKALAGVMTTKAGTPLIFAMMVNNVPLPRGVDTSREGKMLAKLCEILYAEGP